MSHHIPNLVKNAYLDDPKDDWIAVNAGGTIVGRASTEQAIKQAVPDAAHHVQAKHYGDAPVAAPVPEPNPVSAGLDAIKAQQAPAPEPDKDIDDKAPKVAPEKAPAKK